MPQEGKLYYQTCREMAGYTQESAAPLLGISTRQLQRYETTDPKENCMVPDDILDRMCDLYRAPLLAWWHVSHRLAYGRHFPAFQVTQSAVDMGFQTILVDDNAERLSTCMKHLLSDGEITPDEIPQLAECVTMMRTMIGRMTSALHFGEKLLQELK